MGWNGGEMMAGLGAIRAMKDQPEAAAGDGNEGSGGFFGRLSNVGRLVGQTVDDVMTGGGVFKTGLPIFGFNRNRSEPAAPAAPTIAASDGTNKQAPSTQATGSAKLAAQAGPGASSTMLTGRGAEGIDPQSLELGRKTLLGG